MRTLGLALAVACFATGALADENDAKAQAARLYTLAKLAPILCPELQADGVRAQEILDAAGLT